MRKKFRLLLPLAAVVALASGFALHGASARATDGNRFEATFTESAQSLTNRLSDLGTLQLITTGTGTVNGFGSASVVVGITEDHSVAPCGAGSSTNAATRRIALSDGVLVVDELSILCQTASGPEITGTYQVDGRASTGVFAGASGSGQLSVDVATATSTLSGKLHLDGDGS
jgi:hypothetical protein